MPLYSENNPRFITTIEGGWLVAIRAPNQNRIITRTLRPQSDKMLEQAIRWRDRAYRRLFKSSVPARVFHSAPKDTATGIPGVRYQIKRLRKNGRITEIPVIIAEIHTIPGQDYERPRGSRSRVLSLNKYDWDEAVTIAVAWRAEMKKDLENIAIMLTP